MAALNVKKKAKESGGAAQIPLSRAWTQEEQAAKLEGYIEVPKEAWSLLAHGTHIRYYAKKIGDKPAGYRPGGFIAQNPVIITENGREKQIMRLTNGFDKNPFTWTVAYEGHIDRLYMKSTVDMYFARRDAEIIINDLTQRDEVATASLRRLNDKVKELKAEIKYLKNK